MLPDVRGDEPIDLHAYYYANHRWFFALGAITVAISIIKDIALSGSVTAPSLNFYAELVFIVIFVVGALSARERVHKIIAPLTAILFGAYIAVLFTHLR